MSHTNSNVNKNVECHCCGKSSHIAIDYFRKKKHESNDIFRKDNGNYVRRDICDVNGFKNTRMFIYENALSTETNNKSASCIDLGASADMSCNREWYDEYH